MVLIATAVNLLKTQEYLYKAAAMQPELYESASRQRYADSIHKVFVDLKMLCAWMLDNPRCGVERLQRYPQKATYLMPFVPCPAYMKRLSRIQVALDSLRTNGEVVNDHLVGVDTWYTDHGGYALGDALGAPELTAEELRKCIADYGLQVGRYVRYIFLFFGCLTIENEDPIIEGRFSLESGAYRKNSLVYDDGHGAVQVESSYADTTQFHILAESIFAWTGVMLPTGETSKSNGWSIIPYDDLLETDEPNPANFITTAVPIVPLGCLLASIDAEFDFEYPQPGDLPQQKGKRDEDVRHGGTIDAYNSFVSINNKGNMNTLLQLVTADFTEWKRDNKRLLDVECASSWIIVSMAAFREYGRSKAPLNIGLPGWKNLNLVPLKRQRE